MKIADLPVRTVRLIGFAQTEGQRRQSEAGRRVMTRLRKDPEFNRRQIEAQANRRKAEHRVA